MAAHETPIAIPDRPRPTFLRRLLKFVLGAFLLLLFVVVFLLLYNNFSFHTQSRAEFNGKLDRQLDSAIIWILKDPQISMQNPSVMFMIFDMESLSHDPRLTRFLEDYRQSKYLQHPSNAVGYVWARLVDPRAPVPEITGRDLARVSEEVRWDAYGIAPDRVQISYVDRSNMFSPTKYIWGTRQHQLLALVIFRHFNGSPADLDQTINYLADKIARDAHYDFRVTDSYIQRTTFVLAAGRPDLIRPRWVERIMDAQNADGSWNYCWYGWCRGIFDFGFQYNPGHATVQAAWTLTMLKYRYSQWVEEHYK